MSKVYYTVQYVAKLAGRSPQTSRQWVHSMPDADVVLRGDQRPRFAWSVQSFTTWAETRQEPLRSDLRKVLGDLDADEATYLRQVLKKR